MTPFLCLQSSVKQEITFSDGLNLSTQIIIIPSSAVIFLGLCIMLCSCRSSISVTLKNPDIDLKKYKNVYIVAHNTNWDIEEERKDEYDSFVSSTEFGLKDCFINSVTNDAKKLFGKKDSTFIPYYLYIDDTYKKECAIKTNSLLILDEFSQGWCLPYGRPGNVHCQYRKNILLMLIDLESGKELAKIEFNGNYFRSGAKDWKGHPEQKMLQTLKESIETKQTHLEVRY